MDSLEGKIEANSENLMAFYDEGLKEINPGEIVQGKVVAIGNDYVMVDVGFKSEGAIPLDEFRDDEGNVQVKEGDVVDVLFQGVNEKDGSVSLSHIRAVEILTWQKVERVYEKGGTIYGKIIERVKGGYRVNIGVSAFLPGSQVDIKPVRDYESYVGKSYNFKIINYNRKAHNVVLSRRRYLEEEKEKRKQQTLARIKEGDIVYGYVKSITDYGVFVDIGGIDGLLHVSDISWGKIGHPADYFEIGDEVKVKILKFDRAKEKIALGMKQLQPDPWQSVPKKYPVGSRVKGRVTNLADYGAFVEIEKGVEGLIHISEMAWSKRLKHPSEILSVGDIVEAVILDINKRRRRLALGLKQIGPDPWEVLKEKYPVGSVVEGKIKGMADFGIFVEIIEGIEGLVHISDISWTKRFKHPKELYKIGDKIKVKILKINKNEGKVALGIKQLLPDPWLQVPNKFPVGSTVSGKITHITDFGLFVEVDEGIEGLVHISEVSYEKIRDLKQKFHIGQEVKAKVIRVNSQEKKLGLSIKQLEEEEEKYQWRKYTSNSQKGIKLAELIRTKHNV